MDSMLWRQLLRRPAAALSSTPAMRQQKVSSLLLRRLQSTASSPKSSTPFATSSIRPRAYKPSSSRSYSDQSQPPPPPPPKQGTPPVKFWPFLVVIALSSGSYMLLVNKRVEDAGMPAISAPKTSGSLPAPTKSTPTFSPKDVTVVFVLGGPGAGKGTQCANLVRDYHFTHLSAGDLLRAEQDRPGSQFGELIKDCIRNGEIVPMEVTIQLLENAMTDAIRGDAAASKFLIDGFPRKMDQAVKFEEAVCPARFVLFFDCPEREMERRLMERGKTSGRADDNAESIRKRFRTFEETSMPVITHFEKEGKVVKVDATPSPAAVYKETEAQVKKWLD